MIRGWVALGLEGVSAWVERWSDRTVRRVAEGIGALLWMLGIRRQDILRNLGFAFSDHPPRARAALGRVAAARIVEVGLDVLRLRRLGSDGLERAVRLEGLERLEQAHEAGRGVLCLTAHLGSWELAAAAVARASGAPVALVVKDLGAFDRFVTSRRQSAGLEVIREGPGLLRAVRAALTSGRTVVFALDQNARPEIGVFVELFGRPACTMSALALLQLRTQAPVVPAFARREGGPGRHVVRFEPPVRPLGAGGVRDQVVALTQRYTTLIEAAIRAAPTDWLWSHRRFRTRPARPEGLSTRGSGSEAAGLRPALPTRDVRPP